MRSLAKMKRDFSHPETCSDLVAILMSAAGAARTLAVRIVKEHAHSSIIRHHRQNAINFKCHELTANYTFCGFGVAWEKWTNRALIAKSIVAIQD